MKNQVENMINRKMLYAFGMTLEEYTKLDYDVRRMLVNKYWEPKNQKDISKRKKLSLIKRK